MGGIAVDFDGRTWTYDCGRWHFRLSETNALNATVRLTYTPHGEVASRGGRRRTFVPPSPEVPYDSDDLFDEPMGGPATA